MRDGAPWWDELAQRLARANARIVSCTPEEAVAAADETGPELVILGEEVHRSRGRAIHRPQLVIRPGAPTPVAFVEGARPPLAYAAWPVPAEVFLEVTARMLRVAERRTFRTLIRVLRPRVRESFMATSEDFSLTGMGLRADSPLERGETLVVSLHLPGGHGSLQLLAEVTREALDPADGRRYYGARFVNLDAPTRTKLREFVWGP